MTKNKEGKTAIDESSRKQVDSAQFWTKQIEDARREAKSFRETANRVYETYEAQDESTNRTVSSRTSRSNILWANTQLEKPAIYSRIPKVVTQAHKGSQEEEARVMAEMLESSTTFQIENGETFNLTMNDIVQDFQLAGRGVPRIRYTPKMGKIRLQEPVFADLQTGQYADIDGTPVPSEQVQTGPASEAYIDQEIDDVISQSVTYEYVDYSHFLHAKERIFDKVWWVSFDNYLYKDEVEELFGKKIAESLGYDKQIESGDDSNRQPEQQVDDKRALVVEIWDKLSRKVRYICPSKPDKFLKVEDDPLGLKEFFPVPRPLINNKSTRSLKGRPTYIYYERHVRDLDLILDKISILTESLRCVGVHDQSFDSALKNIFATRKNKTFPIDWPRFNDAGGFNGIFQMLPMADVVAQLTSLYEAAERKKMTIDEISGVSDILRGDTNPNETATAQQMKGQYATLRLSEKQSEVQRIARDLVRMTAEIIAEKFSQETIKLLAGAASFKEQDAALVDQAIATLRNDGLRRLKVDIETDSTIAVDEQAEKEQLSELISAISDLFQRALPIVQVKPAYQVVFDEILRKVARTYRLGKQFDAAITQAIAADAQQAEQAAQQEPPPDPAMLKLENDLNVSLQKLELEREKAASSLAIEAEKIRQQFDLTRATLQNSANNKTIDVLQRMQNGKGDMRARAL